MDGLTIIVMFLAVYFIPTMVALFREHHQKVPILVINTFLGWTLIGWVVALAMASSQTDAADVAAGDLRKCPYCAELIRSEATVCRFCSRDVALWACSACKAHLTSDDTVCPSCGAQITNAQGPPRRFTRHR